MRFGTVRGAGRRGRRWGPWGLVAGLVLVLAGIGGGEALAHPLGNFTVSRYDGIVAAPGRLRVEHVEDLAEIPATQARPRIRAVGQGRWAKERCRAAAGDARLSVAGRRVALRVRDARVRVRPGQAGLDTLRVECALTAPLPKDTAVEVRFRGGASDSTGWREITARGDRMTLARSDVPEDSPSQRLTSYPKRLQSDPPATVSATLRIVPGGPAIGKEADPEQAASVLPRGADRWTRALTGLVGRHQLTPGFAALALGTAVLLGALHALAPGHGKTLMAATAAARGRASARDVLPLAASVTVTHTLGVLALGLLVSGGSAAAPSVVAWLGVTSGLLVAGAGVLLVRRAWRRRHRSAAGHTHHHDHPHTHDHPHPHGHAHPHASGHPREPRRATSIRGALFLGFAGGLVPSPSAVVVLVGAAALGAAWFGLLLVVAYGVGLAATLTAAGFLVVRAGAFAGGRLGGAVPAGLRRLSARFLPLGSACMVFVLGCGLVFKGAATALG
ncbi:nickel transporter [Streptomyces sp. NPDC059002]|uniref:HoxN/HupN/NixA family nickel/cobalt transporter n=1 Tax=Streptomyces sp. NPDC059002 TaxID=3346690 RepID=UPI003689ACD1